jgi:hypothetical protein
LTLALPDVKLSHQPADATQRSAYVPSENLYAPPREPVGEVEAAVDIDSLSVSDYWKLQFKAVQKAGGPNLKNMKALEPEEKKRVRMFNIIAFLIGPLYYLTKGMWRKAITLSVLLVVALTIVEILLNMAGFGKMAKSLGYGGGAIYAVLANMDYYRKMVLRQMAGGGS